MKNYEHILSIAMPFELFDNVDAADPGPGCLYQSASVQSFMSIYSPRIVLWSAFAYVTIELSQELPDTHER